jgi:hypothetical protein
VLALYKIYTFDQLNDSYFANPIIPLPNNPTDLNEETRAMFPITSRSELPYLAEYRQKLRKYYDFDRIPSNYFNLPPTREPLPSTPQNLNSAVRYLFPCNPKDSTDFKRYVNILREHYSFHKIPNDYFIQKKPLPKEPNQIKTSITYSFPITDYHLAKEFLAEIQDTYKFNIPLPLEYMTVNPTNKPQLPIDPILITELNLTLPITSPKILVETARQLRTHYFFYQLPAEWISINNTARKENTKPNLPSSLDEIQTTLRELDQS